ncbi:MAG TPA: PIG-L family deacetylase [Gemmatimonadaceae bacterium]|jgi:LmbE family N-acetylglucosaminyl deacetylase
MTMRPLRALLACAVLLILTAPRSALGQDHGAAALDHLVHGLTVTPRVLVIAAHPDDEDTQLIAWLSRGRHVETAYLSLTRGDGGQNLIGNELGEALGAIRTEELLAARRIDGGRQYFTRAYDFGFSKSAEETFKHWDHEDVLRDVVTVVRAFRPNVIVAVFSGTPRDGHGHHQVSGIVAREAYDLSADTVRFPVEQYGPAWAAQKFYRGARFTGVQATISFNVGEYDPVAGRSYAEIAGESRSQHRSQGFGVLQRRGVSMDAVARQASRVNEATPATSERSIFDGIDTSLARLDAGLTTAARAQLQIARAYADSARAVADLRRPDRLVPHLSAVARAVSAARRDWLPCVVPVGWRRRQDFVNCTPAQLDADAAVELMYARSNEALLEAAGVAVEVTAERELLAFGDSMPGTITVYNRGTQPVTVRAVRVNGHTTPLPAPAVIAPDSSWRTMCMLVGLVDTRPWWVGGRQGDMFADRRSPADGLSRVSAVSTGMLRGVALREDSRRESEAGVDVEIAGVTVSSAPEPFVYRFADPVLGEQNRPVGGAPAVSLAFDRGLEWLPAGKPMDRMLRLTVQSYSTTPRTYTLKVLAPKGITVDSVTRTLSLEPLESRELFLRIRGTLVEGRYEFGVIAEGEMGRYAEGFRTIEYSHIHPIRLYRSSGVWLQAVNITVPAGLQVAYVQGVGDLSAAGLRQLGVPLTVVTPAELPLLDLTRFTTVIVGPRAYQASPELRAYNRRLLQFVKDGGTMLVQYGQQEMARPGLMPYPVSLGRTAQRVTLEDAPVTVLDPKSRLLNWPNRITEADWTNWVQERALYMPGEIDRLYETPVEMHDPDEPANRGAMLMATYGKGTYVYTTLSLFRQFPAGVPGSARLFVNLLSQGRGAAAPRPARVQP